MNAIDMQSTQMITQVNASALSAEIAWFEQVLTLRMEHYFKQVENPAAFDTLQIPDLTHDGSEYAAIVNRYQLNFAERIVLILAIIPHVKPQALDILFVRNQNFDRGYTEFGGIKGQEHSGFLPTCETAAFILAGDDIKQRFAVAQLFKSPHCFVEQRLLKLERTHTNEPFMASSLLISDEYLQRFTSGETEKLDYSINFPAKLITTPLQWDDLVLDHSVMDELHKVITWITHNDVIMHKWGMAKTLKPGYRTLFYGPPGTGKTLTATLMGLELGFDVYRVDLSSMISKYIGETEKNLANLFDQAQNKNWVLFFDEADALFGARSSGNSANERHANQEVAYLLQRVEDFPGLVILATNLRANIDEAFSRRFQSMIYFPMPDSEQRVQLWQKTLNGRLEPNKEDELFKLAEKYELAGGAITNVVRYAAICAIEAELEYVSIRDLKTGINKELRKEGRTL